MIHKNVRLGKDIILQNEVSIGLPSRPYLRKDESEWPETIVGDHAVIRSGTKIYCAVVIGSHFQTGHNVMVREDITIGDHVSIGTNSVIDSSTQIGSHVNIQSIVYLPTNSVIEDNVFIGPNSVFTNDKYPVRKKGKLIGPILKKGVTVGANATVLPGITVGEGAVIAAGAVVTRDIPAWSLAIGCPAQIRELPEHLKKLNMI